MEKLVVCVPKGSRDCYGHHTRHAIELTKTAAQRKLKTEILYEADADFHVRLSHTLKNPDCLVHFYCYLYDLLAGASWKNIRAQTVATVSDHPFSEFLVDTLRNAHPMMQFILIDHSFADEMLFLNASFNRDRFTHVPFEPPITYDPAFARPFAEREYDLVVPLFLTNISERIFGDILTQMPSTWLTRAAAAAYETVLNDLSQNPYHVLDAHVRRESGMSLVQIRDHSPATVSSIIKILNALDLLVRQERRHIALRTLLRSVGDLRVVVLGNPVPSLQVDEKVIFAGMQHANRTAQINGNARAILNCSPSYPNNVHERITVGMLYGSCVITDVNPCLEQMFSPEKYVSYAASSGLTIADIFHHHDVQDIARTAQAHAESDGRFSWNGYLDRVLAVAAKGSGASVGTRPARGVPQEPRQIAL